MFRVAYRLVLGVTVVVLAAPAPAIPQTYSGTPFGETSFSSSEPRSRAPEPPRLAFRLESVIPLPGPLPGEAARLTADGRLQIPVAGGVAATSLGPGATAELLVDRDPSPDSEIPWVPGPRGKRRFRTEPQGLLRAEKCCTVRGRRWYPIWKLRIAGGTPAPPLVAGNRVFVGALDNQVYALRTRNGHRIWTADVGRRVTSALALWRGNVPVRPGPGRDPVLSEVELILVTLRGDRTSSLLALDARSGRQVAQLELAPAEGRIVGPATATPEGRIVVARQRYAKSDAGLMVYRLEPRGSAASATDPVAVSAAR